MRQKEEVGGASGCGRVVIWSCSAGDPRAKRSGKRPDVLHGDTAEDIGSS